MGSCVYGDQPLRVKFSKDGVVHAASSRKIPERMIRRYDYNTHQYTDKELMPEYERINIVCKRYHTYEENPKGLNPLEKFLVPNNTEITCKHCMKLMGLMDPSNHVKRFVLRNKKTGEYYKGSNSYRCVKWTENVYDAFFYKVKGVAEKTCKHYFYYHNDKEINYFEYIKLNRTHPSECRYENKVDPDIEILQVKISTEPIE